MLYLQISVENQAVLFVSNYVLSITEYITPIIDI